MKTLAGANPDAKPDYRSQALTELSKLESKVILLNELLDNVDTIRGEQFSQGDVYNVRTSPNLRVRYVYPFGPLASRFYSYRRAAQDTRLDLECGNGRPRIAQHIPGDQRPDQLSAQPV